MFLYSDYLGFTDLYNVYYLENLNLEENMYDIE